MLRASCRPAPHPRKLGLSQPMIGTDRRLKITIRRQLRGELLRPGQPRAGELARPGPKRNLTTTQQPGPEALFVASLTARAMPA